MTFHSSFLIGGLALVVILQGLSMDRTEDRLETARREIIALRQDVLTREDMLVKEHDTCVTREVR